MRKSVTGFGVATAILLAGCSGSGDGVSVPVADDSREAVQEQAREEAGTGVAEWAAGLMSGKKFECEYAAEEDGGTVGSSKVAMDRERYRTEVVTGAGTYIAIYDGDAMYSWISGQKQGTKMTKECMDDFGVDVSGEEYETPETESYRSSEEMLESIPGISCREVSSIDLSVPSDVVFTDQCEMMKQSMEQMKQLEGQIPDSVKGMMNGQ